MISLDSLDHASRVSLFEGFERDAKGSFFSVRHTGEPPSEDTIKGKAAYFSLPHLGTIVFYELETDWVIASLQRG